MECKVGELLRYYRKKNKITQKEISDELGFTTSQFLSNLELGKSPMPPYLVGKISSFIGIPYSKLTNAVVDDYRAKFAKHTTKRRVK